MKLSVGRFDVSAQLPQVGRKRLVFAVALMVLATVLWFWSALRGLAGVHASARIVVAGVAIPWGIGWVTLLLMERRILRDMKRVEHRPLPERDRPVAVTTPITFVKPGRDVVEGEVLG